VTYLWDLLDHLCNPLDLETCAHHDHNQVQVTCALVGHAQGESGDVVDRDLEETGVWDVENIWVENGALVDHGLLVARVLEIFLFLLEDHILWVVDLAED
jgi:hypothetical protein